MKCTINTLQSVCAAKPEHTSMSLVLQSLKVGMIHLLQLLGG